MRGETMTTKEKTYDIVFGISMLLIILAVINLAVIIMLYLIPYCITCGFADDGLWVGRIVMFAGCIYVIFKTLEFAYYIYIDDNGRGNL